MKTIVTSIVCALALSSSVVFASTDKTTKETKTAKFEVGTYITKDDAIRVSVKKSVGARVYVTLRNAKNDVLYEETMGKNDTDYAAKLRVNDLADGLYKLEISSGNEKITKDVNVSSKKIEVERSVSVM
jgi:hypothetical protein